MAAHKTGTHLPIQANRWRKRGLTMMPLRFGIAWDGAPYTVLVSIFFNDGTVAIAHGGVEIGQGINTKVLYSMHACVFTLLWGIVRKSSL